MCAMLAHLLMITDDQPLSAMAIVYFSSGIVLFFTFAGLLLNVELKCKPRSYKPATDEEQQSQKEDSETFTTAFGWALESYKKEFEGFELWSVISRTTIIIGSTIMYPENRFGTNMVVMSWSLFLHARFRPYLDYESNFCAILFCICDILGAITAFQTYGDKNPSAFLQIIFLSVTFITMIVVGVATTRGIRAQAAERNII